MATSNLAPPTSLVGYVSEEVWFRDIFVELNEYVPELIWPASIRTFNELRRDPRASAILSAYTLPIRRATWQINPAGCRPEVAQLVADDLGLPVMGLDKPGAARTRGVSWTDHIRQALLHLAFGHYPFELGATIDDKKQARLTVLSERIPHTITDIRVNRDGTLAGFSQFALPEENNERPEILAQNTVWYVHDREGANWTGTSLLRNSYSAWLIKREMLRVHAVSNRRFGMGVPVMEALPGTNPTDQQMTQAQQMATSIRVGESGGAATPPGFTLAIKGLTGSVPDTLAFLKWLDQEISTSVLAGFLDLGQSTHGSRALGQSFIDLFMLSIQSIANLCSETATREIAARIVDWNWGPDEPVPAITVADVASTHEVTAEVLGQLMQFGAITPDPALDKYIRGLWQLPVRTGPWVAPKGAGAGPTPTTEPTPAPEPNPDLVKASRSVQAAAADTTTADQAVGHRDPTPEETAAGVDFAAIAAAHAAAVAALLAAWPGLTAGIAATLADDAATVVAGGDLASLNTLVVPGDEVAALVDAIANSMDALSILSAAQAVAEAKHQGVAIGKPKRPGADHNSQVAEVLAQVIADAYVNAAKSSALRVSGDDEAAVRQAVEDALTALGASDSGWASDNANAAMSAAQAAGRAAVFADAGPGTVWISAEALDRHTCSPCENEDGSRYETWAEAAAVYGAGPFVGCLGRWRCRGQLVALHGGGDALS